MRVLELDNNTRWVWEVDFFDNILFVWVFELKNTIGDIGDNYQHFGIYQFRLFSIFALNYVQPQGSKT